MGVLSQKGCESSVIRSSLETHTHTHVTRSTAYIVCGLAAFEKAPLSHVNIIEQQSELQCAPVFQRPDTHTHTVWIRDYYFPLSQNAVIHTRQMSNHKHADATVSSCIHYGCAPQMNPGASRRVLTAMHCNAFTRVMQYAGDAMAPNVTLCFRRGSGLSPETFSSFQKFTLFSKLSLHFGISFF